MTDFTEAELNMATLAGISSEAVQVAKEYPEVGFGNELRKHLEWGSIEEMVAERQQHGMEADVQQYWLGGGFTTNLAFRGLVSGFAAADPQNKRILYAVFGARLEEADVFVPDDVPADVKAGNVLIFEDDDEATEVTA